MAAETEVDRMVVRLLGDDTSYEKMLKSAVKSTRKATKEVEGLTKRLEKFSGGLRRMGASLGGFGRNLTLAVTAPIVALGGFMLKAASDAEETESKFDTVFSSIGASAQAAAKELDESFGLTETSAKSLLANTGDLLSGFGFTDKAALDLAVSVQELAVDLASFSNIEGGAKRASESLTKALLGERESIKELGIAILEEDVKKEVARQKTMGLTFATERQAKAQATLTLAIKQSGKAIGDYGRTQDSVANQTRELLGDVFALAASFGKELIPVAKDIIGFIKPLVKAFTDLSPSIKQTILVVAGIAAVLGPVLILFGALSVGVAGIISLFGFLLPLLPAIGAFIGSWGIPIAAATAAIVGLVGVFNGFFTLQDLAKASAQAVRSFGNNWLLAVETGIRVFALLGSWILNNVPKWFNQFVGFMEPVMVELFLLITNTFARIGKFILDTFQKIGTVIGELFIAAFTGDLAGVDRAIKNLISGSLVEAAVSEAKKFGSQFAKDVAEGANTDDISKSLSNVLKEQFAKIDVPEFLQGGVGVEIEKELKVDKLTDMADEAKEAIDGIDDSVLKLTRDLKAMSNDAVRRGTNEFKKVQAAGLKFLADNPELAEQARRAKASKEGQAAGRANLQQQNQQEIAGLRELKKERGNLSPEENRAANREIDEKIRRLQRGESAVPAAQAQTAGQAFGSGAGFKTDKENSDSLKRLVELAEAAAEEKGVELQSSGLLD